MRQLLLSTIAAATLCLGNPLAVNAHDTDKPARPVTSSFMLKAGSAHRADSYLSPLRYNGWLTGFEYERFQAPAFNPQQYVMALNIGLEVDATLNSVRNSRMWGAAIDARWALMRRFALLPSLDLGIGGSTSLDVGALYLQRNGNNPVAAKASWTLDASGYAAWRVNIGRLPVVMQYRATLPVVGAFFAPDYGQLYYEIYMGDSHGVVSAAYWSRYFALDQQLTVDLRFGATALRLGYSCDILSTKANGIVSRSVTHTAIIGVSGEWLSLSPSHRIDTDTRIINAIY